MTTNELKQHVVKALNILGYETWVNNVGRKGHIRFGKPGLPDVIGYSPDGFFVGVECKNLNTRDKLTLEQGEFLARLAKAGGKACVVSFWTNERGDQIEWSWRD